MSDLNFSCTQCGKCCHDLRLPLTRPEAIAWLQRGGTVEVLCEAVPWVAEPAASDAPAMHKRQRSFPACSGELPIRVIVVLAASFKGACPHLGRDMQCGIYDNRPHVCRIYPAEVSPFRSVLPSHKQCPPEAWTSPTPFVRNNQVVDAQTQLHVSLLRHGDQLDVAAKAWLCIALDIQSAGLSNEGFMAHCPSPEALHSVLQQTPPVATDRSPRRQWSMVTNQATTFDALCLVSAKPVYARALADGPSHYLGFRPDAPPREQPA
ncbi:YkgJ family cysteine cluster protein [Dyella flava]|uniref:YkgJ family cysteine cluster protein n=1 Tax=Dyella flava TaxID=1920170 RepID=A0ABS2JZZ3_9GAMM|nr:YkgJ family cysteine cluster protein [Dyella flava]MBM7124456.1 YkgJ family cysteine cluster protein [Dyella flava]GLQ51883.1 Fe-S oxidoreductase [Dyella flava]